MLSQRHTSSGWYIRSSDRNEHPVLLGGNKGVFQHWNRKPSFLEFYKNKPKYTDELIKDDRPWTHQLALGNSEREHRRSTEHSTKEFSLEGEIVQLHPH